MSINITVYSDYVCPFCYLGNIMMAELEVEYDLTVEWRGYIIHKEGKASRFLEPNYVQTKWNILRQLAAEMGRTVERPTFVPHTAPALEGSEFAKEKGLFKLFHDRVFAAYFEEGKDIGDGSLLKSIAGEAGLDPDEFSARLDSGEMSKRLDEHRREAQENAITSFPTFLFDGLSLEHFRVVGAHPLPIMRLHLNNYLKRRDKILAGIS